MLPTRKDFNFLTAFDKYLDNLEKYLGSALFDAKMEENRVVVDVPGFNKDNLTVNYNNGSIEIYGENDSGRTIHKFIRSDYYKGEPRSAEVKDGILTLEFEKSQEESKKIELS